MELVEELGAARERTLALVALLRDEQLDATFSSLMSPLAWDLGHIAAFEDLWLVHRHGGRRSCAQTSPGVRRRGDAPRATGVV